MEKIWQHINVEAFIQPLKYDVGDPAAKKLILPMQLQNEATAQRCRVGNCSSKTGSRRKAKKDNSEAILKRV
jgi:hypothetical protein